jgi:hypothetical protein
MLCIHGVWNDPTLTLFKLVGSDNGKQLLERYYYQQVAQKAHIPAFFVQWCGLRLSSHSRREGKLNGKVLPQLDGSSERTAIQSQAI